MYQINSYAWNKCSKILGLLRYLDFATFSLSVSHFTFKLAQMLFQYYLLHCIITLSLMHFFKLCFAVLVVMRVSYQLIFIRKRTCMYVCMYCY